MIIVDDKKELFIINFSLIFSKNITKRVNNLALFPILQISLVYDSKMIPSSETRSNGSIKRAMKITCVIIERATLNKNLL